MSLSPVPGPSSALPADQHTIETPEQIRLQFNIAGIGSRFLAVSIDTLIQLAALVFWSLVSAVVIAAITPGSAWSVAIFGIVVFVIYFGYFAGFEIFLNGQTPGKRFLRIRVLKEDGRPLTPAETIARNLLRIVDQLPGIYGVGIVCALLNDRHQRLGDLAVSAIVVRESSLEELKSAWSLAAEGPALSVPDLAAHRLTSAELALIENYLRRRLDLTPDIRTAMAERIANQIRARLATDEAGWTLREGEFTDENILEALALQRRARSDFR